jgi:hypothetical protein
MKVNQRWWFHLCWKCGGLGDACSPDVICIRCGKMAREIDDWSGNIQGGPVMMWICLPCGGIYPQPGSKKDQCFLCHRTLQEVCEAGLVAHPTIVHRACDVG